ncbi:FAD-dependent monooxygenase [Actinacidiphila sp. DG2A-62]|uniref:FAD-dependent monooxygenase n=1 Tax=Actinacidiphila sp. DG2A-62 TaxID=3108821 RepID=UPI002DB8A814|nr:FAD-dependent monooxygenase [Actinacidiphila sp. DG2A-62]MEC3997080.1 FAD-dependent monooxygenase [Actinacidiphila sp. DG2A-62]
MNTHSALPFVVVGAGIGGVGVALALARHGHPVLVLEQALQTGEIGAGIQLGPNALRVLDHLGVLEVVGENAVFPPAATMRDATTGEVLTQLEFGGQFLAAFGYPYMVTHRSDLHAGLLTAAEATGLVRIRTGCRLSRISKDAKGDIGLSLANGEQLHARALIGADGLHSVVRRHVVGPDELVHSGDFAYRGTVPYADAADREGKDDMTWWVGASMHLIQYPVRGKSLYNQVAVFSGSHRGPDTSGWDHASEFAQRFEGKHPLVMEGAAQLDRKRVWSIVDRAPIPRWSDGRVTLLGDAAHPMVQYLAQGGCQALEDVACLAECVTSETDIETAFKRYEAERAHVAGTVQRWARAMGRIVHASGTTADLRNELLRARRSSDFRQVHWLYGHRPVSNHRRPSHATG